MLYLLVTAANWRGQPGCVTSLPSWSCGFDSRRSLHFINNFRFGVPVSLLETLYRTASLPIRHFSSSIGILELSYVSVKGWLDDPSFCERASSLKAGHANLNPPPAPP